MERFVSLLGVFVLLGLTWLCSSARRRVPWRIVTAGIGLQVYLALFIVRPEVVPVLLTVAAAGCVALLLVGPDESSGRWPAFAGMAARLLGYLGVATTLVYAFALGRGYLGYTVPAALGLLVLGWTQRRRVSGATWRLGIALAGCVAVVGLIWLAGLPRNFVFLALMGMGTGIKTVVDFAGAGAGFIFGGIQRQGFVFAIDVGAIVLLFSALMSALYYVGALPWLVGLMGRVLHRALGVSGAESLAAAANVFVGQTEAPLVVRPYLARMTRSEIMALMTGGFATIAGSVFGAYVKFLSDAGLARGPADLIAASVMSAPAAFVFAKMLVPETEESETATGARLSRDQVGTSFLDALAGGVTAGVRLAVNIVAMLLVFYALIQMLDTAVGAVAGWYGHGDVTFRGLYAYVFAPFAFLMGVPWSECLNVGELLGTKTIFNEFLAYDRLGSMIAQHELSTRAAVLSTYALCGFANFMSIGIQIGGLSALAPERRPDFARAALPAMLAGALACQLTACIVGVVGVF